MVLLFFHVMIFVKGYGKFFPVHFRSWNECQHRIRNYASGARRNLPKSVAVLFQFRPNLRMKNILWNGFLARNELNNISGTGAWTERSPLQSKTRRNRVSMLPVLKESAHSREQSVQPDLFLLVIPKGNGYCNAWRITPPGV